MGSYGRSCQLLLVVVLAVTIKGALSSGRNLLQTTTCNSCTDYGLVLDSSTTIFNGIQNAAGAFMASIGGSCSRFYVSNCDYRGVNSQLTGCTTDRGFASKLCFSGGLGGGNPDWGAAMKDGCDKLTLQASSTGRAKKLALFISNSQCSNMASYATQVQYCKNKGVEIIVFDFGTPKQWASALCSSTNYVNIATTTANYWSQCGLWLPKPANCPLLCQPQVLNLIADKTTKMCKASACPATTLSSNTCYQVYLGGALTGATISASPNLIQYVPVGTQVSQVTVTSSKGQSCYNSVTINCYPAPQCVQDEDCASVLPVPATATCTRSMCVSGKCAFGPAIAGTPCDDGNACTGSPPGQGDTCDGANTGGKACNNPTWSANTCADAIPPGLGSLCYGKATCNTIDGTCSFPLLPTAINQAVSANSYCGTWGGAFATQLVSGNNTVSPQGSTVFSSCTSKCASGTCATDVLPYCSCNTFASSYSFAQAGTSPPCPTSLNVATNGLYCKNGVYTLAPSDAATCWYPDANVKSGEGGVLSYCPGKTYTEYVLTGGTSISQCMACMTFGSAYSSNATACYAGGIAKPVDP